eukprot:376718-Pyramimonas_sp.AAC.1
MVPMFSGVGHRLLDDGNVRSPDRSSPHALSDGVRIDLTDDGPDAPMSREGQSQDGHQSQEFRDAE